MQHLVDGPTQHYIHLMLTGILPNTCTLTGPSTGTVDDNGTPSPGTGQTKTARCQITNGLVRDEVKPGTYTMRQAKRFILDGCAFDSPDDAKGWSVGPVFLEGVIVDEGIYAIELITELSVAGVKNLWLANLKGLG